MNHMDITMCNGQTAMDDNRPSLSIISTGAVFVVPPSTVRRRIIALHAVRTQNGQIKGHFKYQKGENNDADVVRIDALITSIVDDHIHPKREKWIGMEGTVNIYPPGQTVYMAMHVADNGSGPHALTKDQCSLVNISTDKQEIDAFLVDQSLASLTTMYDLKTGNISIRDY
jgi:hypothetical protein